MQVNVTQSITDLDGQVIRTNPADPASAPYLVRALFINAILMPRQNDAQLDGESKLKRFLLAQKIHDNDTVDLNVEDCAELKRLAGETFSTLVYARIALLLDPPGA